MATNVFGEPITNETLKLQQVYQDKETITQLDKAMAALKAKNSDRKDVNARAYVENLRQAHKSDGMLCVIYNATGESVTIDADGNGRGTLGSPYPLIIANGQWGAFFKITNSHYNGEGAIVYAAKNADNGAECQFIYKFQSGECGGLCLTEIQPPKYYPRPGRRTFFDQYGNVNYGGSSSHAHDMGFSSFASIGGTTKFAAFEGIMTLQGAWSFDLL